MEGRRPPFPSPRIQQFEPLFGPMKDVRKSKCDGNESDTGTVLETRSVSIDMTPVHEDQSRLISSDTPSTNEDSSTTSYDKTQSEHQEVSQQPQRSRVGKKFDVNLYASKKSAVNGLLDIALLMANASQLKHILLTKDKHQFYALVLGLLISSLLLQLLLGLMMLTLARMRITEDGEDRRIYRKSKKADVLNNYVVGVVFLLTAINVFIAAFGLNQEYHPPENSLAG